MKFFWRTKSWRKFLERLKQKIDIFMETKTYLTLNKVKQKGNERDLKPYQNN